MLSDLDRLMTERGIALLIVPMYDTRDPSFRWLSRGAKLTRGFVAKRPGGEPLLVHFPMEREEARLTGLPCRSAFEYGWDRLGRVGTDPAEFHARFFREIAGEQLEGSMAIGGNGPIPLYHQILRHLEREGSAVWNGTEDLIQSARKRKDAREIEAIRAVGRRTEEIVDGMRSMLRSGSIREGTLWVDQARLTIGDLKDFVTRAILERGMIEDHETILSQAVEAAIPHCRGTRERVVRIDQPIVIDIFPADRESGYFFDYTRTLVVGDPSARFERLHGEVLEAFERAVDACRAGMKASDLQHLVCDFFEQRGHPTTRTDPATKVGYVHGLGHGVGLEVHEKPSFSIHPANEDRIEIGDVLTIEPGLYYPDENIGIRIEETFVVGDDGRLESLCRSERGWRV